MRKNAVNINKPCAVRLSDVNILFLSYILQIREDNAGTYSARSKEIGLFVLLFWANLLSVVCPVNARACTALPCGALYRTKYSACSIGTRFADEADREIAI
jgi:hypothetical protein